jgi:adenylate cyclase
MPDAAHTELRRAELRADRLSAAIRAIVFIALVAIFATMDIARQHQPATATSLTVYGVVAAIAVVLAWRRIFHPLLAYALVTIDVVVLTVQLTVLVRHFSLPHAAVYAIPASGLIFLVLAHAALRFRPGLVVYAALLFIGLLEGSRLAFPNFGFAASSADPHEAALYGHALPLAVIALFALALWAGGAETRRTLDRAIEHARRAASLSRFFSPAVANRLAGMEVGTAGKGDRRKVAILFIDMQGFTMLGQILTPDALADFLTEFRAVITKPVFDLGGAIDKFIGDGALVIFGSPEPRADAAARAIRCGRQILEAVAAWSKRREKAGESGVRVGIGGHYGEVFAGIIGADEHLEFTVIGDVVNIAERVERLTRDHRTDMVVSADMLAAANALDATRWQELPEKALAGHGVHMTLYALA